jgi:predicted RNA-binding protein
MENEQYLLVVFSAETWQDFIRAGGKVMGFNPHQRFRVEKIKPGDLLLCYVMQFARFIGILEVKSKLYIERTQIWQEQVYPYRLRVEPVITVNLEEAVRVVDIKNNLLKLQSMGESSNKWGAHFRTSPSRWPKSDYETIINALKEVKNNKQDF